MDTRTIRRRRCCGLVAGYLKLQTKLHQLATDDHGCRFDDFYDLPYDPLCWLTPGNGVKGNRGGGSARADRAGRYIKTIRGGRVLLSEARDDLGSGSSSRVPCEKDDPKCASRRSELRIPSTGTGGPGCREDRDQACLGCAGVNRHGGGERKLFVEGPTTHGGPESRMGVGVKR